MILIVTLMLKFLYRRKENDGWVHTVKVCEEVTAAWEEVEHIHTPDLTTDTHTHMRTHSISAIIFSIIIITIFYFIRRISRLICTHTQYIFHFNCVDIKTPPVHTALIYIFPPLHCSLFFIFAIFSYSSYRLLMTLLFICIDVSFCFCSWLCCCNAVNIPAVGL